MLQFRWMESLCCQGMKTTAMPRFRLSTDMGVPVEIINKVHAQKWSSCSFTLFYHFTLRYQLPLEFDGLFFHSLILLKYKYENTHTYAHICNYTCISFFVKCLRAVYFALPSFSQCIPEFTSQKRIDIPHSCNVSMILSCVFIQSFLYRWTFSLFHF